ncbi:MAG: hypothetical protein R2737_02365 [Candidatus Nanopelagicales bacterium]
MSVLTCSWCGTTVNEDADPLAAMTWTVSVEGDAVRRYCPACARDNLRSIEAKLDSPDW